MSYKVEFLPDAFEEFQESSLWYEEQQYGLGEKFKLEVYEKISLIQQNPEIYPKHNGLKQQAVLSSFPFVILFRLVKNKNTIFIVPVFHTRRNPKLKNYRKSNL